MKHTHELKPGDYIYHNGRVLLIDTIDQEIIGVIFARTWKGDHVGVLLTDSYERVSPFCYIWEGTYAKHISEPYRSKAEATEKAEEFKTRTGLPVVVEIYKRR